MLFVACHRGFGHSRQSVWEVHDHAVEDRERLAGCVLSNRRRGLADNGCAPDIWTRAVVEVHRHVELTLRAKPTHVRLAPRNGARIVASRTLG